jgi:bifunctional non-homologous end joining protein LigD
MAGKALLKADINDGKRWSAMDIADLKNHVAHGATLVETAWFLCRSGSLWDVAMKAKAIGLEWQGPKRRAASRRGFDSRAISHYLTAMHEDLQRRIKRSGPIEPCLPRPAKEAPRGPGWIHEIKHDGFRILARREAERVRLFTRHGTDFTDRFPKIAAAVDGPPVRSCVIDGEAIVVDERGLSVFDVLWYRLRDHAAVLCAFDLVELDGKDLRWQPLEHRKATLADLLRGVRDGIAFNQHFVGDGATIFRHACALGCEGIVSKRLGSHYRSGRVDHWLKIKKLASPAVRREAEEEWGEKRWARGRRTS